MSDSRISNAMTGVEDDYPEYPEQSFGFAYEVDDVMSQGALRRRDELMCADAATLEQLDVDNLDDFERWTAAHAWRRLGEEARFVEIAQNILASEDSHPVIVYSEISRGLAWLFITEKRYGEAAEILDAHSERWPDDLQGEQLAALLAHLRDDDGAQLEELASEHPGDAELRYEFAEDLWQLGRHQAAKRWLEKARRAANETGDRAVLVDITLLEERLEENAQNASS